MYKSFFTICQMYVLACWPMLFVTMFNVIHFVQVEHVISCFFIFVTTLFVISTCLIFVFRYKLKGVMHPPYKIKVIKFKPCVNILVFLLCTMPIIAMVTSEVACVVYLTIIMLGLGILYFKYQLIYINPTLYLFQYNVYEVQIEGVEQHKIVLTKLCLNDDDSIRWIPITDKVWIAK